MTTYAPVYELDGAVNKVCVAYIVQPFVQDMLYQTFRPAAVTELARWLLDRADYVPKHPATSSLLFPPALT